MKILPFKIPKTSNQSFWLQIDHEPHFYNYLHQHPEIQITLIIESEGKVIIGDYVGEFRPGYIYVIGPDIPHVFLNDPKYYKEGNTGMAHSISIFFESKLFGRSFLELPEMKAVNEFLKNSEQGILYGSAVYSNLEKLIRRLFKTPQEDRFFALLTLLNKLSLGRECKLLANKGKTSNFSEMEGKRLDAIYRFTLSEYHRKISLEEVADIANFTVNSFCRYFKKRTRKSYISFLTEVRINQACKLLVQNELSVSDISENVGFLNLSNFNRLFKKMIGVSPTEFRRKNVMIFSNEAHNTQ